MAITSSTSPWSNLSNFTEDAAALFSGDDPGTNVAANTKDFVLEPIATGLKWVQQLFGCPTNPHVETVETLSSAMAPLLFVSGCGDVYREYFNNESGASRNLAKSSLLTVTAGSETALFLDKIKFIPLKESLNVAKSLFWGPLFIFDGMNIFEGINQAEALGVKLNKAVNPEKKEIIQHRINHNFLCIARSAATVAMASIALVSILFASLANGILFSPIVFLSLSSAWIVLNCIAYFYEKMINRWDTKDNLALGNLHGKV